MSGNSNNTQQPGMVPFQFGFMQNQMMQSFFPPMQANQFAGVNFNEQPFLPQMMTNFPSYFNPYPPMGVGGMLPQLFGGQYLPQFLPAMAGQTPIMNGQMALMASPAATDESKTSDKPMTYPGAPLVQYMMVPVQMGAPVLFPPNAILPTSKPMHIKEDVIECTPARIEVPTERRPFSIAGLLDLDEVKREPVGEQDHSQTNTLVDSVVGPTVKRSLSPIHDFPQSLASSDPTPRPDDEIPDTPASPDYQPEEDPVDDCQPEEDTVDNYQPEEDTEDQEPQMFAEDPIGQVEPSVLLSSCQDEPSHLEMIPENISECDEYVSSDETQTNSWKEIDAGRLMDNELADDERSSSEPSGAAKETDAERHEDMKDEGEITKTEDEEEVEEEQKQLIVGDDVSQCAPAHVENTLERRWRREQESREEKLTVSSRDETTLEDASPKTNPLGSLESEQFLDEKLTTPPSIPRRFDANNWKSSDERIEKSREPSTSPWAKIRSPIRWASPDRTPRRKRARVSERTLLLRGVPVHFNEKRILRFFDDQGLRCRRCKVRGEAGTLRIEFARSTDRNRAYSMHKTIALSGARFTVHKEYLDERERSSSPKLSKERRRHSPIRVPSLEKVDENSHSSRSSTESRRQSPVRVPTLEEMEAMRGEMPRPPHSPKKPIVDPRAVMVVRERPMHLERQQKQCNNLNGTLTAGPIPPECSATSVIHYFRSIGAEVLDVPFLVPGPRVYLVLRLPDLCQAKKVLAATEHRVDGHQIAVSPPYVVHLKMCDLSGNEEAAMSALQSECGVLVAKPAFVQKTRNFTIGYVAFGRPQDALNATRMDKLNVLGGTLKVVETTGKNVYHQYQKIWEVKCLLDAKSAELEMRVASGRKRKANKLHTTLITDYNEPLLTVGPIPEQNLEECDEYLLSNFKDVYEVPFPSGSQHFRIIVAHDNSLKTELLTEGYLHVGRDEMRLLVSPSFDVTFTSATYGRFDPRQVTDYMQRKYGPIVRKPHMKGGALRLTFGRIQDGQCAIAASPHFKSLQIMGVMSMPNHSFNHFGAFVDSKVLEERARLEEAANIRIFRRMSTESAESERAKPREESADLVAVDDDVLVCSPVRKKAKRDDEQAYGSGSTVAIELQEKKDPEPNKVILEMRVRVCDTEQWIPERKYLLDYFSQFGQILSFDHVDHLEATLRFAEAAQAACAVESPRVKIGGRWLEVCLSTGRN